MKFFRKFAEIFANQWLSAPPVSTTPAVNFATAGVVDSDGKFTTEVNVTGAKFATGVNDTGAKFATSVNVTGGE